MALEQIIAIVKTHIVFLFYFILIVSVKSLVNFTVTLVFLFNKITGGPLISVLDTFATVDLNPCFSVRILAKYKNLHWQNKYGVKILNNLTNGKQNVADFQILVEQELCLSYIFIKEFLIHLRWHGHTWWCCFTIW